MSKPKDELPSIDPTALATVSGGASSTNPLITQLNGILDSVKEIKNVGNANGINPTEMMLFMMLMQRQNQQTVTIAAPVPQPVWVLRR